MITLVSSGDFNNLESFFKKSLDVSHKNLFKKYGELGVKALTKATPVDTGKTANAWTYKIVEDKKRGRVILEFHNSNVVDGTNIAMILQYGHATKSGGWVEGVDYINPALNPVFEKLTEELWKEVKGK